MDEHLDGSFIAAPKLVTEIKEAEQQAAAIIERAVREVEGRLRELSATHAGRVQALLDDEARRTGEVKARAAEDAARAGEEQERALREAIETLRHQVGERREAVLQFLLKKLREGERPWPSAP